MTTTIPPARADVSLADLVRAAGATFLPVGALARLPLAMLTLGVSAYVVAVRGSYADGGYAAAAYALGSAVGGPIVGALADRFGQRAVVLTLAPLNALAIASITLAGQAPLAVLLLAAALTGLTVVPAGPFSRARWSALVARDVRPAGRPRAQAAAFGYETLVDELTFVFGPAAVGIIARYAVGAPLWVCVGLVLVFGTLFALHRTAGLTGPRADAPDDGPIAPVSAYLRGDRLLLLGAMAAIGALFGTTLNATLAFAGERGQVADAGLIYAAFGLGSGVASLAIGVIAARADRHRRWLAAAALATAGAALLPFVGGPWALAGALTLLGLGIGPVIVTLYELIAAVSPQGRGTLTMTLMSSAMIAGNAVGSAVTGVVAQTHGAAWGFAGTLVLAVLLALLALPGAARRRPETR